MLYIYNICITNIYIISKLVLVLVIKSFKYAKVIPGPHTHKIRYMIKC